MKLYNFCTHCIVLVGTAFIILGAACAPFPTERAGADPGELPAPEAAQAQPADLELTEAEPMDVDAATNDEFHVTELTFAGNGDTFLEKIAETATALEEPVAPRFIEMTDPAGVVWQGEALIGATGGALLLQAQQSGSAHGVQIELTGEDALGEELLQRVAAALPPVDTSASAPDVSIEFVRARQSQPGVWSFDVTLNHADTGWEDYTDGWHVATADGTILGTRILLHPHETEMPFTRSLSGVPISDDVKEVLIRAHDLVSGYEPHTVLVPLGENGNGERYEVTR